MIKEILTSEAFTYEDQPDGGRTTMIDPYDGCQLNCPYCFQLNDPEWNKDILVKTNIAEKLVEALNFFQQQCPVEDLYFGSRCDPYMPLEKQYRLTRQCLSVLKNRSNKVFITTKSNNGIIFEDIELIKSFSNPVTVLMGLSNIHQAWRNEQNENIKTANILMENGIAVWAFITPVLPYIMDVGRIVSALDKRIPVYMDKIRVMTKGNQDQKMIEWVKQCFPQHLNSYKTIIIEHDETYYQAIREKYKDNTNIKFLF